MVIPARQRGGEGGLQRQGDVTRSDTAALLRSYHEAGDTSARQRLIELYLPLVESLTRRYTRSPDEHDDLYQVGCIGLINAIDRFDVDRGDELAAFAVPNIAGEIRRYLRDRGGSVRIPRRVLELRASASHAQTELRSELGRPPTAAEVAAKLSADEQDVALALEPERISQALELSSEAGAGEGGDRSLDAAEDRLFLSEAFRGLDERERRVLHLRYLQDVDPSEIARRLGISRRQVSRDAHNALTKLRAGLEQAAPAADRPPALSSTRGDHRMQPVASRTSDAPKGTRTRRTPGEDAEEHAYHIELVKDEAPEGPWTAQVAELPGCTAQGGTAEEAARLIEGAIRKWVADAVAKGREVPKPRSTATHSGKLLIRMPQSLHGELARAAERDEVSLNQFITSSLASAVGWRRSDPLAAEAPARSDAPPSARKALVANLVVLSVVAVLALVLLVVALGQL
jgi:RNA polymerase sigma-B factor